LLRVFIMKTKLDENYRRLAADCIIGQLKEISQRLPEIVKGADMENIHRARVASRHLRAALKIFSSCFSADVLKKWRKGIRAFTRGLGGARDADVQIAFVAEVLNNLAPGKKKCRPGILRLLLRLEQKRESLQPKVLKTLTRLESDALFKQMSAEVKTLKGSGGAKKSGYGSKRVFAGASKQIHLELERLFGFRDCLEDTSDAERHHKMRIAAKRLRYTMVLCNPAYEGGLDNYIAMAKTVQTFLGEIHDCDVWALQLRDFRDEERERMRVYFGHVRRFSRLEPGIDYLVSERAAHRKRTFSELKRYWRKMETDGFRARLLKTVDAPVK